MWFILFHNSFYSIHACINLVLFTCLLKLLFVIVKVRITTAPRNLSIAVSENVTFTCVATGNRAPNIRWIRHDGMELSGNISNQPLNATTTNSTLIITSVTSNDFANYYCLAENTVADNIIENIIANDTASFTLYEAGEFVM